MKNSSLWEERLTTAAYLAGFLVETNLLALPEFSLILGTNICFCIFLFLPTNDRKSFA
jgi:hypothetical protein